jgi:anti-anti-sigma factor
MANDRGVSRQVGCALATGAMIVIADMTGTRFCDSRGLRALVLGHKQATAHHTELRLVIASANVLRALAITKLDTVVRIYPSLDAVQAAALPGEAHSPRPAG